MFAQDLILILAGSDDAANFDGFTDVILSLNDDVTFSFEQFCIVTTANIVKITLTFADGTSVRRTVSVCHYSFVN